MKTLFSLLQEPFPELTRVMHGVLGEARVRGLAVLYDNNIAWDQAHRLPEMADAFLMGRVSEVPEFAQEIPWVGLELPQPDDAAAVLPDVDRAAQLAYSHLRGQGLSQFAFYRNLDSGKPEQQELEKGFVKQAGPISLFRNGRHVKTKWTLMDHLLDVRDWVVSLPKPVGIFCGDEEHAVRLLRVLDDLALRVPEDVAVMAYGVDLAHETGLGLSGIDSDPEGLGAEAVRVLAAMLEGNPLPSFPVRVPPKGVRTGSTTDRRFAGHPIVRRVIQDQERSGYVRQNVEDIAADLGVSKTSLNLAFREATGNSIGEELRRRRLEHAVHLLETTDQRVTEIAFDLGYDQSANFSRDIKMFTGKTPKEVRG